MILKQVYDKEKGYVVLTYICSECQEIKTIRKDKYFKRKYRYCSDCYQKSPERKVTAQKVVKNRRSFDGENNPNFHGKIEKTCKCGIKFQVVKSREHTAKYCSYECAAAYRPHAVKHCNYKGINFRSSWEMLFAQFLDSQNIAWEYESEVFQTSFGKYVPDFWVMDWNSFVEIKGYFRDDAKQKFEEFSKNNPVILGDKKYLKNLGIKIK